MWKIWVSAIVLGAAGLLFALGMAGMFDKPDVSVREMGPFTLVYKKVEGEYQQAVLYSGGMRSWLAKHGAVPKFEAAMFFDDPRQTDVKLLRYITGVVIAEPDGELLKVIKGKYLVKDFPRQACMVGVFPYRSKMTPVFGMAKMYPALDTYRAAKGYADHPVMEMLDTKEKQMVYLQPLEPDVDLVEYYYLSQEEPAAPEAAETPETKP